MFNYLSSLTVSYFGWQLLWSIRSDEFGKKKGKEMETPFSYRMEPILRCKSYCNTKSIIQKRVTIDSSLSAPMCPRCNLLPVIMSTTICSGPA
uniref:Secreted protein n=1 Tax=Heterorhabditis bacteriophora TaxID=37862 RepID=A0A1I7XNR5_HETBA